VYEYQRFIRGFASNVILRSEATKNLAAGKGNDTLRYAQGDIKKVLLGQGFYQAKGGNAE